MRGRTFMCFFSDDAPEYNDTSPADLCDNDENTVIHVSNLSRRDIRSLIFHILYAAESHGYEESVESIIDNLSRGFDIIITPDSDVVSISRHVIDLRDSLDDIYKPLLTNWRFDRVSVSIKLILRLAVWELLYTNTDQKIIINEAVELAKCFAEEDAYRFINGILDGIAQKQKEEKSAETVSSSTEETTESRAEKIDEEEKL